MRDRRIRALCLAALVSSWALAPSAGASATKITKGEHCPYKISTPHFEVEFSVSPKLGKGYGSLCEKAYAKFCKLFNVSEQATVWEGKCHVYLFRNRAEFQKFATSVHQSPSSAMSGGYTRINKNDPDIVLFLHGRDHIKLQQTVIHEMTHVFLQLFHKDARIPLWVHEGFAQYFEFQHYPSKSRLKMARRIAKSLVKRGNHAPLNVFWVSSFGPQDLASYSQAWSLIDFIAGSKTLRRKTGKFVLKLKDSGAQASITSAADLQKALEAGQKDFLQVQEDALKEIFGMSLAKFEAGWKRYVLSRY